MALEDPFVLAGKSYRSRLIVGSGKYRSFEETRRATEAAGAEIVTVAVGGEVVPRSSWADRTLAEGDQVEVLQAVQGG